jgi:ribosomal protein S8
MYYDLLAKTKNAVRVKKESFLTPFSNLDFEVAKLLADRHYLKEVEKKMIGSKKFLEIRPAYKNGKPSLNDFRIISKPSRHIYASFPRHRGS